MHCIVASCALLGPCVHDVFHHSGSCSSCIHVNEPRDRHSVLLQVKFERAVFETPQLLTDKEFPSSLTILGTSIDLTNLKVCLAMLFGCTVVLRFIIYVSVSSLTMPNHQSA